MIEHMNKAELECTFPGVFARSEEETEIMAANLAVGLYGGLAVVLTGPMGSGKTFLVRAIAETLGIIGIKSPTFAIETIRRVPGLGFDFIHADMYRLDSPKIDIEIELQLEEYLSPPRRAVLFVEWGEKWNAPASDCWKIDISASDWPESCVRMFGFKSFGVKASERLAGVYGKILDALAASPEGEKSC